MNQSFSVELEVLAQHMCFNCRKGCCITVAAAAGTATAAAADELATHHMLSLGSQPDVHA
jgi:hypothetical protein